MGGGQDGLRRGAESWCCILLIGLWAPSRPAAAQPLVADTGTCLVRPAQLVNLGSSMSGVIAELMVDRGQEVARGQLVARLDTTVEEAQAALDRFRAGNTSAIESARTNLAWNQRELARRRQIADNMFSRANEVDEMTTRIEQDQIAIRRAEAEQRLAELEAVRSQRALELMMVRSPVRGVVTEIKLNPGEFVYQQAAIMVIAQVDPLHVDVVLPADRYRAIRIGMVGELLLDAPIGGSVPATVDAIDPLIDAASDTFRARLTLPNPGNAILAGIRCSVRFADPQSAR